MQIVIDIPENIFKKLEHQQYYDVDVICNAILSGKPLPEHHGRLGDLDALEEYFRNVRKELKASDYKNGVEFFVRDEMLLNIQQFIHLCDAIIEADKGGSDSE